MKKGVVYGIILSLLINQYALAAEKKKPIELSSSQAHWNLTKKTLGFTIGAFTGLIWHEFGHQTMAWMTGNNMNWDLPNGKWTCIHNKDGLRTVALGGFGAQIISTEIILSIPQIPKGNSFILGWLAWNITHPIFYTIRNEIDPGGYGDLKIIQKTGLQSEYVETALIIHAFISAVRLYKNPDFPLFVKTTHKEIVTGFSWRW